MIPSMATGASDGVYTNAAGCRPMGYPESQLIATTYALMAKMKGWALIPIYTGVDFYYRYLKAITSQP